MHLFSRPAPSKLLTRGPAPRSALASQSSEDQRSRPNTRSLSNWPRARALRVCVFPERAEFPATTSAAWRLGFSATRLALNVRALWRFTVRKALHKSHESQQERRGNRRASASTAIVRALPLRIGAIRCGQRKVLENEFQTNVRSPSFGCFGLVFLSHMTVLPARASLKASTLQNKK